MSCCFADVDEKRARNKRNQVESLVAGVRMIAKKQCKIVDFCSGGVSDMIGCYMTIHLSSDVP